MDTCAYFLLRSYQNWPDDASSEDAKPLLDFCEVLKEIELF